MAGKKKSEIFISIDIEADGRVPGLSSMLSFAAAAYDYEKNLLGTFERNLELLPNAQPHPDTTAFWNETPANLAAYHVTRENTQAPDTAMPEFVAWLKTLPGTPIFIGYPAAFDFKWIDYYCHAFAGDNPFGFSRCIDVKTYAWAMMGSQRFAATSKQRMPKNWFDDLPHTHIALDDAIEQGAMFVNMLRISRGLDPLPTVTR
jgi:hypothetical protein